MCKNLILLFLVSLVVACKQQPENKTKNSSKSYFDLEHYFKKEALRLKQQDKTILKEVIVNGKTEKKEIQILNWEKEFDAFIKADINKPAWKGEFRSLKTNSQYTYTTTNEKIQVKKVIITNNIRKDIKSIQIFISTKNYLYQVLDTLSYYPDSLYKITSTQKIKLLNPKRYEVSGVLK